MPVDDGRSLVFVSDFHMSSGYSRRRGTFDRNEDFFYDGAFSRFINNLIARGGAEGRAWRLVILGDFVDFLQVPPPREDEHGLTSSETTIAKLDVIAQGHAEVFAALGRFLNAGHVIDIVLGNHDIEFIWPEVQQRFKDLVAQHAKSPHTGEITFHPWIFYVPGLVYAEHGQQYDGVNSFTALLQPQLPDRPRLIELPLGSFFVLYLFNYIERIDPFADNVKPVTRYLIWALRTHPFVALSTAGYHLRFFVRVLRKTSDLSAQEQRQRRERYRREALAAHAAELGLPAEILIDLDRLAAVPAMSNRWRQLEALLLRPILPGLPVAAMLLGSFGALQRIRPGLRSFWALVAGLAVLLWRERRLLRPVTQSGGYLFLAARNIHARLSKAKLGVPAYVFGHTHTAEQVPLDDEEESPRYINCGTWTPLVPHAFDLLSTRERFSFVQITRDPANDDVISELLVWNDGAERAEPLPLLTPFPTVP